MEAVFRHLGVPVEWSFLMTFSGLLLTRLLMVTLTIPFLTGRPVPAPIKMGLAVTLLVFLYPSLAPEHIGRLPREPLLLMLLFLKEGMIGFLIGFAAGIAFYGFEAAGLVIDNQRGAAQARVLIPQLGGQQSSLFGNFNFLLGVVLFLSLGGHLLFLRVLIESYQALPLLEFPAAHPDTLAMAEELIRMTGTVLVIAVSLSAPVILSVLVSDIVLGITNRIAPQINVWEMGFAIRGVVAVLIVFLTLTVIADQMEKYSLGVATEVGRLLRFLSLSS